ncbi:serine-rich adhesin for platelets [Cherax quadricarinatus]
MPLKSAVEQSAGHYLRRSSLPLLGRWTRAWLWACMIAWACLGVSAELRNYPEAEEDNHFIFRTDGTYSFSYDTGSGKHQSFRIEERDSQGHVSGRFGYVDPDGVLRITQYRADSKGYRANMEVFHLVSVSPSSPLIVGPLPQRISQPETLPDLGAPPRHTTSGPIEPSPFIPPQRPVLIIGPLPKPLQPPRSHLDQTPPDLNEDSLLGTTPENLVFLPPPELSRGPRLHDSSQIPSPEILDEKLLNAVLQSTFEELEAEVQNTSIINTTFENNHDTFQETDLQVESDADQRNIANLNTTFKSTNKTLQDSYSKTEYEEDERNNFLLNTTFEHSNINFSDTTSQTHTLQSTLENGFRDLLQDSLQNSEQTTIQTTMPNKVEEAEDSTLTGLAVPFISDGDMTINVANHNENNSTFSTSLQSVSDMSDMFVQVVPEQFIKNFTEKRQNDFHTEFSNVTSESTTQIPLVMRTITSETTTQIPLITMIINTSTISQSTTSTTGASSLGLGTSLADDGSTTTQFTTVVDNFPPAPSLTYLPVSDSSHDIPVDVFSQLPSTFTPFA